MFISNNFIVLSSKKEDVEITGYEFIDGVILDNPEYTKFGCTQSFINIFEKFLSTTSKNIIIFEDDILVSKNFKEIVTMYMQELMPIWDFFSFFVPDDSLFAYNEEMHDFGEEYTCRSYQQWSRPRR